MQFDLALQKAPAVRIPQAQSKCLKNSLPCVKEWEAAAGTDSLLDVTASTGLILLGYCQHLELTAEERSIFLGNDLNREIAP